MGRGDQMYQALYRKYRPTKFEEIIGQEHITKTLASQIQNKSINHAYLFTGKVGYIWNKEPLKLLSILILNVIFGYIIGYLLSIANPSLIIVAQTKVHSWGFNLGYFFKSVFCFSKSLLGDFGFNIKNNC